jgi:hypothetical protein
LQILYNTMRSEHDVTARSVSVHCTARSLILEEERITGGLAMLQTASYPASLPQTWDTETYPYYLELFGETQPYIDESYAEILPAGSSEGMTPQQGSYVSIYQYWWTVGCHQDTHKHYLPHENEGDEAAIWATISLYFPISGGWRMKELLPTIRDLKPFHEQVHGWQELSKTWNEIAPVFSGVAALPLRMVNPLMSIPLALLPSFSKLHINTVQPEKDCLWSVEKVSRLTKYGLMQGVTWNIPKKLFRKLGGRLTGSLAVCFIPSQRQQSIEDLQRQAEYHPQPLLAQAVLGLAHHERRYIPAQSNPSSPDDFLELYVAPVART